MDSDVPTRRGIGCDVVGLRDSMVLTRARVEMAVGAAPREAAEQISVIGNQSDVGTVTRIFLLDISSQADRRHASQSATTTTTPQVKGGQCQHADLGPENCEEIVKP